MKKESQNSFLNTDISGKKFSKKDYLMVLLGFVAVAYLLNFSFGVVEFLPDNIPLLGNIDEALATAMFISVLEYFGIRPTGWFKK